VTDPNSLKFWVEMEANEVRLFVGEPTFGLWCRDCQLPSGWEAPVQRDPAEAPGMWVNGCANGDTHHDIEDGPR
jgi:uncharacterized protein YbdZ (MbtH family)